MGMKWKLPFLILVAGSIVALISLRGPSSAKALLPDGIVLELSRVQVAKTNEF